MGDRQEGSGGANEEQQGFGGHEDGSEGEVEWRKTGKGCRPGPKNGHKSVSIFCGR